MYEISMLGISVYFVIAGLLALRGIIFEIDSNDAEYRRSVFWPIYTVRWLAVNAVLAFKGK